MSPRREKINFLDGRALAGAARPFVANHPGNGTLSVPVTRTGFFTALLLQWALASSAHASATPRPDGYLVVPFANRSPVKALDWMSSALASTVAEKLETHPSLRPTYGANVLEGASTNFDEAKVAAKASDAGARWVVAGSFARPNWKAEVAVRLYEVVVKDGAPSLRPAAQSTFVGERAALLDVLDQTLQKTLEEGGLAVQGEALAALKRSPTRDLYALTLYGRALNLFYGIAGPTDEAGAQKLLAKVIHIDPKFAEAHRMLGVVLLARNDPGKAAGQYAHALDLRPNYYAALVSLARLYRAENRRLPAEEMAQKALEVRPWDDEMRFLLGQLEFEAGELDKALADLLRVVGDHPHHVGGHRALVQVYAAKGDIEALAASLEQVAALLPDDIEVRLDLGATYMRLAKHERAIAAYEEVLRKKPRHVQALKFSGDLYRKVGEPERAIASYEKMRRMNPDDPRPYFLLGSAYVEAGNDTKAEQVLQDATQFHRYLGEAWMDLGAIALRRGELNRASWYLGKAVARAPHRPKAHFNYALVLDQQGQRDRALDELRTAEELDPEDAEAHFLAGVIYLRLGRLDEAKAEFAEAIKRNPAHADAQHNLALLDDLERRYGSERSGAGAQ